MRPPIYRKKTNIFQLKISVNGVPVDIRSDTVTLYMDKDLSVETPAITVVGDVSTSGLNGIVQYEITPTLSDQPKGRYKIQAVWELAGDERTFIVLDDEIDIREVVKA